MAPIVRRVGAFSSVLVALSCDIAWLKAVFPAVSGLPPAGSWPNCPFCPGCAGGVGAGVCGACWPFCPWYGLFGWAAGVVGLSGFCCAKEAPKMPKPRVANANVLKNEIDLTTDPSKAP